MKHLEKESGSIYCNEGAWKAFHSAVKSLRPYKVFIIADSTTRVHCLPYFLSKSELDGSPEILEISPGEKNKNIASCVDLWETLTEKGATRNTLIINLGGGMVSDLGGFVASTFKRGVPFINIPTTLLAMVDASVGGKTGVDLGVLKNQIGIINNPYLVIVDTHFLSTLPMAHFNSGVAEMLKHGLIHSESYWDLVAKIDRNNSTQVEDLIWESIQIKNQVVTSDPYEKDLRKTLNYGHTLGHAIESYCMEQSDKPELLHGEAIAIGLILSTYISTQLFSFSIEKLEKITEILLQKYPKVAFNKEDIDAIIDLLIYDKKNIDGQVLFVLLEDFGKHQTNCEVSNEIIYDSFDFYHSHAKFL